MKTSSIAYGPPLANYDPIQNTDHYIDGEHNGGVYNSGNLNVYGYCYQNPVLYTDPNGKQNVAGAVVGAGVGALIGGLWEMGSQYYKYGEVKDWKEVGGAAEQGAVTGAAAGFTSGGSLIYSATATGTANVIGGGVNNIVQGKDITVKSSATDFVVGVTSGVAGNGLNKLVAKTAQSANGVTGLADDFLASATKPSGKPGLTTVGRALQKHAGRQGFSFADIKFSGKTGNQQGLNVLNDILSSKNQIVEKLENGTINIFNKGTGRGVYVSRTGEFNRFRDIKLK